MDAIKSVLGAVDLYLIHHIPAQESRNESGQAQNMVQMAVGQEDLIQTFKPHTRLQDLPLGAFTTVN